MMKFNIGDRVVLTIDNPDGNKDLVIGSTGAVAFITDRVGVRWDDEIEDGHDLGGACDYGHGWWVDNCAVEPEQDTSEPFEFDEDEFNKLIFGDSNLT